MVVGCCLCAIIEENKPFIKGSSRGFIMFITVKDYAKQRGITIQAVHQSMKSKRKQELLNGHVFVQDGVKWLDEEAVAILDKDRSRSAVVIEREDNSQKIQQLEEQVKQLLVKVASQADTIAELSNWKAEHSLAIATAEATKQLLEMKVTEAEEKYSQLVVEINELEASKTALDFVVDDLEHRLAEQKQTALETALQHQNELEALETHYNTQIALESDKWKSKSLLERLLKK